MSLSKKGKRPRTAEITRDASIETLRKWVKLSGPWHYLKIEQVQILQQRLDQIYQVYWKGEMPKQRAVESLQLARMCQTCYPEVKFQQPGPSIFQTFTNWFSNQKGKFFFQKTQIDSKQTNSEWNLLKTKQQ